MNERKTSLDEGQGIAPPTEKRLERKPKQLSGGALKALLTFSLLLNPQMIEKARADNRVWQIIGPILGKVALDTAEKHDSRRAERAAEDATRKLNEGFNFDFPQPARFLVETNTIGGSFHGARGSQTLEEHIRLAVARILEQQFQGCSVVNANKVEQETTERKRMRENDEVNDSTLPPKRTMERENVEVTVTVMFFSEQKDIDAFVRERTGWKSKVAGLNVEKASTTAVGDITFTHADTQTGQTMSAIGTSGIAFTSAGGGFSSSGGSVQIGTRQYNIEAQTKRAIGDLCDNAAGFLKSKYPSTKVISTGTGAPGAPAADNEIKTGEPQSE